VVSRQRDTIARPRIDLDYAMLKFVFDVQDESGKIGIVLEIVDDYPCDLRFQCLQDAEEIHSIEMFGDEAGLRPDRWETN
jgi:hypothetical protein